MPRKKIVSAVKKPDVSSQRRSTRQKALRDDEVPEIYKEMLVEAYRDDPQSFAQDPRPSKRRKIDDVTSPSERQASPTLSIGEVPARSVSPIQRQQQLVFQNDFDDSDESEVEFEDVEIDRSHLNNDLDDTDRTDREPLQINLGPTSAATLQKSINRRKPVTKAERLLRLDVHKWHVLSLLMHIALRSQWCDDQVVQKTLKPLIPRKIISRLHLDESESQAKRKVSFDQAIEQICQIWRAHWTVDSRGMRRAFWRETVDMERELEETSDPVDLDDFREAAKVCEGTRDLGAQLFCALLRSVAVETRLVCSLQVLPFSRVAKGETPQKPSPAYVQAGRQNFGTSPPRGSLQSKQRKNVQESPYPIFWVEVLNPAITQWIPLDPIVRNTINKPRTGFEPPASDNLNSMCYVIAFEDDGTAKDITRRYAAAYNAKTRRNRVESTYHGEKWWNRVMSYFEKSLSEPRDDIEEAALNRQVAVEGMPKNVQDFRDHPVYVLERHLRANEVIEPKREAGKFAVGIGKNQKVESVYRRQDVHSCKSADGWYRKGRDVRAGELPLKRVISRNHRPGSIPVDENDNDSAQADGTPLYAEYQTDLYIPPPVVNGIVPRNGYGNLDIYVQGMIPAGAVHFQHPLAMQAARTLKIDFAEAVTGFSFRGRQGTAIVNGIVISTHHTAALLALTKELETELEEQISQQRSAILLAMWKKMLAVLRVRQRIQDEYGTQASGVSNHNDDDDPSYRDESDGGGFMPDVDRGAANGAKQEDANLSVLRDKQLVVLPPVVTRTPVVVVKSLHMINDSDTNDRTTKDRLDGSEKPQTGGSTYLDEGETDQELAGGFMVDDNDENHAPQSGAVVSNNQQSMNDLFERSSETSGHLGISSETDDMHGGGFLVDVEVEEAETSQAPGKPEVAADATELATSVRGPQSLRPVSMQTHLRNDDSAIQSTSDFTQGDVDAAGGDEIQSQTSELSHDPDEDDLEPEWLADAFED